ncbi:DUF2268 domain-containing protein [Oceanobacillus senegalensis]|uniref:DUF2268 domain-containing protein n=1 Tax=Oceanobacillus senegalensis TaxID=1936063 RepID=UPI000A30FE12|nr:DUF2268 domain-containing protein [Oceanobacillus senegalensis]
MSIIQTDKWIADFYDDPKALCKKLHGYFNGISPEEIFHHLIQHGMYRYPLKNDENFIDYLQNMKIYQNIKKEHLYLMDKWNGPDIPIFILPSDRTSRRLKNEYNGKSGLAFKDKLFLFLSEENTMSELRALFTHEYNHVCRLLHSPVKEENFTLLDTIILEGLAENAVQQSFNKTYLAPWTTYYSEQQLRTFWRKYILPHKELAIHTRKHHELLYGLNFYPRMLGYSVGYYLVNIYLEESNDSIKNLLSIDSKTIAKTLEIKDEDRNY